MDLDQAMQLLAQRMEAPDAGQVRSAVVRVVSGRENAGLTDLEAAEVRRWFQTEYGGRPDPAGALYQAMLSRVVETGIVQVRRKRGAHRATGAYYTQELVVRYMLDRARDYLPGLQSVIDPACGSGAFLAGARSAFPAGLERLTGLDADPIALEVCRQNVPGADLHAVDALLDDVPGEYDLCVGNPPYISSGLRGVASQERAQQRVLRERYPRTAQYKINTYPLFVERGLQLVRDGGVLGYILPDSFLSGRYFEGLRRLLLANTLLEITLVCEDFWEHGRVGQSVILFVRRGPAPAGHQALIKVCPQVADLERTAARPVAPEDLAWGALLRFPLITDPEVRRLARAMEAAAGGLTLGQFFRSYSGLIARQGQQSLLRSANPGLNGPWGRLLRSGREIDRYRLAWAGEEVCLDPALIKSGGLLAYYQQPKILLRQTADSLRAVYDDQGYYCLNNIHLLTPRQVGTSVRAFLGLINSGPVDRFYRAMTMETGRLYPQVDLDLLESLPVPPLADEAARRLELLVRARESAAPDEAAHIEAEINEAVEQAYGLS
ncbi:MAG TPA: TaqI-like C-terminal specificity domain-containing protein [Symbiobacteriaceae bacterium]|nr:TaqI-like C-terminal specificity domain-containing protein [Symbiobacteriaceae bacterium]